MRKIKIFSLVLGMICLTVSAIAIFNGMGNNDISNMGIDGVETINKEYKIGINTDFKIVTEYTLCGHQIINNVEITRDMINLSYDDIITRYSGYEIVEFDSDIVILKRIVDEYCGEHYLVKENEGKIGVYIILDNDKLELMQTLDVSIDSLRQNDRYMFKNTGVTVNGKENLYQFLEDFDS